MPSRCIGFAGVAIGSDEHYGVGNVSEQGLGRGQAMLQLERSSTDQTAGGFSALRRPYLTAPMPNGAYERTLEKVRAQCGAARLLRSTYSPLIGIARCLEAMGSRMGGGET